MTYLLRTIDGHAAIRCLLCDAVSFNSGDVSNRYCGRCRISHDSVAEARELVAAGGTHDCGEWRTARDVCALCGRVLEARGPDEDP